MPVNESISIYSKYWEFFATGLLYLVAFCFAVAGLRMLLRPGRGTDQRSKRRRAKERKAGAGLLLIVAVFCYMLVSISDNSGAHTVEFRDESMVFHDLWRTDVVPYAEIESVQTKITESGTRRGGSRTRIVVSLRAGTREYIVKAKYYDAETRAKVARVAELLGQRSGTGTVD
jgi:hypothetical protein